MSSAIISNDQPGRAVADFEPGAEPTEPVSELEWQPASIDIWDKKYRLRSQDGDPIDATPHDTLARVAHALAEVEPMVNRKHWESRFLWALHQGAIPAGRIISNAGASLHKPATSTINCTVSGTIHDSMADILAKTVEAGMTLKSGAGIGYEFSTLRPRGAFVAGAGANTSGPLSFMDIFDRVCATVSSAGARRGAQMATFDVGHPDVMEFIRAKREDGRLRNFNLSLLITDDFIKAVREDGEWKLSFPVMKSERERVKFDDPDQVIWREWPTTEGYTAREDGLVACRVYKTIRARRLWDTIMASTYDFAEPGFILIDRVNEMNNNWWCENIRATNPCVTADTWVHTAEGPRQVAELMGVPFAARVDGQDHCSGAEGFFRTATKPVVRLETVQGHALRLTTDHRVRKVVRKTHWSLDTDWCAAADLKPGDEVLLNNHRGQAEWSGRHTFDEGFLLGLLVGDGTLAQDGAVLSVWAPAVAANGGPAMSSGAMALMMEAERVAHTLPHRNDFEGFHPVRGCNEFRMAPAALRHLAEEVGMTPGDKRVTPAMERASSAFQRGFLRGLFDTDGSVQGSQDKGVSIRLSQPDEGMLETVQRMLLRLGIASTIYRNRRMPGLSRLPNGRGGQADYATRAQHELVISSDNVAEFARGIGFADTDKQLRLSHLLGTYKRSLNRERFVATVHSVREDGVEDVYDVQVPGINAFDGNGLHAHNCGEQPLPPYGSCLLGSINLTRFVSNPFSLMNGSSNGFDWQKFRATIRIFTRMLDNVVEINGLPLEEQRNEIMRKRRHGMGFLGLGSTMAMLDVRYDSQAGVDFANRVSREIAMTGWAEALSLAREKGPAPIMNEKFTVTEEMLRKRPEMVKDGIRKGSTVYGRVLHAHYSRYMQRIAKVNPVLVSELAAIGARFTHHSSIAPTGTIALSFGNNASNGIEPSFAHSYSRNIIREGRKTKEKVEVLSYELLAYRRVVDAQATTENLPEAFVSSDSIKAGAHVDVQAAAQEWTDSSISKTINVPTDYPYDDFKEIYLYAADKQLKGCTTFRFNPEAFQGVLVKEHDLASTIYRFTLADGSVIELKGNETVEYDGETHTAANLFDALKEGYYGKF